MAYLSSDDPPPPVHAVSLNISILQVLSTSTRNQVQQQYPAFNPSELLVYTHSVNTYITYEYEYVRKKHVRGVLLV